MIIIGLCTLSSAYADLEPLSSDELENQQATINITAFKNSTAPIITQSPSSTTLNDDFRIQQELNALRLNTPADPSVIQSIQLENQILQGPNSNVQLINNNQLNF